MTKIFLSHSSADNAEALAIAQWLDANGWSEYFLDINPERGIAAGERWQEELKRAAHRCEAVVFFVSRSWLSSKWCLAEFLLAKNLGKNIFGVLIEPVEIRDLPTEMSAEYQVCDLTSGVRRETFTVESDPIVARTEVSFATAGLDRLRIGLKNAGLEASSFPWPPANEPNRAPYRGLKPLQPQDAAIHFGRDATIIRCLDELRQLRNDRKRKMLVLLGASGCGKSSFLRAGLWPRLKRDDRHFIPLPVVRPARDVIGGPTGLATCLAEAFGEYGVKRTRGELDSALREKGGIDSLFRELHAVALQRTEPTTGRPPSFVLALDQGEELFTSTGSEESLLLRRWLADTLADQDTGNALPLIPMVTIRTDLYEPLQTDTELARIDQQPFNLKPIDRTEYKGIIEGPARRATEAGNKLVIDPALTSRLLQDAEGNDALPLLAFTLERLFVDYGSDGDLRLDEYDAAGGVQGALGAAIDASLEDPDRAPQIPADKKKQHELLKLAFVPWLAGVDERTGERRRRQANWDKDLPKETHAIVTRLVEARLLRRDKDIVEVAHEALLRQWAPLIRWLDEDADILRATVAVERAAADWDENGRASDGLVHFGERLSSTDAILRRRDLTKLIGQVGEDYLAQCKAKQEADKEKKAFAARQLAEAQRKTVNRTRWGLAVAVALAAAMGWAYFEANEQKAIAEKNAIIANEQKAIAEKNAIIAKEQKAIAEKNESNANEQKAIAEKNAIIADRRAYNGSLAFVSDRILANRFEEALSALDDEERFPVEKRESVWGHLHALADHASRSEDNTAGLAPKLCDPKQVKKGDYYCREAGECGIHFKDVTCEAASPIGPVRATSSRDGTVRLWDCSKEPCTEKKTLTGHARTNITSVAFSHDGSMLASAGLDAQILLWGPDCSNDDCRLLKRLIGHTGKINAVAWWPDTSPDKLTVVSGSSDSTLRFWDANLGEVRYVKEVYDIEEVEDCKKTVVDDCERLVRTKVEALAFPTTSRLYYWTTGNKLDSVTLPFDSLAEEGHRHKLVRHPGIIFHVAYSPDGNTIAMQAAEATHLVNARTARIYATLEGKGATFSPDGKWLATGNSKANGESEILIWDAGCQSDDCQPVQKLPTDLVRVDPEYLAPGKGTAHIRLAAIGVDADTRRSRILIWKCNSDGTCDPNPDPSTPDVTDAAPISSWNCSGASCDLKRTIRDRARSVIRRPFRGMAFSRSSNGSSRFAAGYEDSTIQVWDCSADGKCKAPATLKGHTASIWSVAFSPDGNTLVSGGDDFNLRIWDLSLFAYEDGTALR